MFELIGLVVATVLFFVIAALAGLLFALLAWILLRRQKSFKKLWIIVSAVIPLASAAYMFLCAAIFSLFVPGATDRLFGDFNEPLPNGYIFKGLAKMPDFAYIDSMRQGDSQPQLLGSIARIDVDGPLVFGEYSHKFDSFSEPVPDHLKYFIFDTHTRQIQNLVTLPQENPNSGHPLHLVESQFFRSHEPAQILRRRIEDAIYFGPPILVTFAFFIFLFRIRKSLPAEFAPLSE
jgi:hypothetical protein